MAEDTNVVSDFLTHLHFPGLFSSSFLLMCSITLFLKGLCQASVLAILKPMMVIPSWVPLFVLIPLFAQSPLILQSSLDALEKKGVNFLLP